jgi:hypothetical protein
MPLSINFNSTATIDNEIIPYVIYNETINRETEKIQDYFILHPRLLVSFVGYNSALKLANQLSSDKKTGNFYTLPWITYYQHTNNTIPLALSFSQQVEEYRYMNRYWLPSPVESNMEYLSRIALTMIQEIRQYKYYTQNNLYDCAVFQKKYYINNFNNVRTFNNFIINI